MSEYGAEVLEFIPDVAVLCPKCKGVMVRNGTLTVGDWTAHNYLCQKCKKERRIPTKGQMRRIQEWASKRGRASNNNRPITQTRFKL